MKNKKKVLLSLSLVALVGLFDCASAMKRKFANKSNPSKERKLLSELEEEVIDINKLKETKPNNSKQVATLPKIFPKEIWQKIKEFFIFTKEDLVNLLLLCKGVEGLVYQPGFDGMRFDDAIKVNNKYFSQWFDSNANQLKISSIVDFSLNTMLKKVQESNSKCFSQWFFNNANQFTDSTSQLGRLLLFASRNGYADVVEFILNKTILLNSFGGSKENGHGDADRYLQNASCHGHADVVKVLLDKPSFTAFLSKDGLCWAILNAKDEAIANMLKDEQRFHHYY